MRKVVLSLFLVIVLLLTWMAAIVYADADPPVVNAVLFYSQNCPHCHTVISETLPPLQDYYGEQLQVRLVDTTTPEGQELYMAASEYFQFERQVVPILVVGDAVLVGGREIPQSLPGLIEQGLASGGVDWPPVPGLSVPEPESEPELEPETDVADPKQASVREIIARDMPGNAIAIGVLVGMLLSVGYVVLDGVRALRRGAVEGDVWRDGRGRLRRSFGKEESDGAESRSPAWWDWAVLALCVFGLIVAGYLAYVETTQTEAVCGPVGDCNAVQESEYALLFGLVPIAVMGVAGYAVILAVWAWGKFGYGRLAELAPLALLGLALFGTGFSIYLTFLEPFVIGATCSWCLTSAVSMTLLLLLFARPGWETLKREWL